MGRRAAPQRWRARGSARSPGSRMTKRTTGEGPNPGGLCWCGCGGKTPLSRQSRSDRGDVRGTPVRYIMGHKAFAALSPVEYIERDCGYKTPCWVWQRAKGSRDGYGRKGVGRRVLLAHRVYFERVRGPIPKGLQLDHLCRVRACVNPDHLEPVTSKTNVRRGSGPKLSLSVVPKIRARFEAGESMRSIGRSLGVSHHTISAAIQGRSWSE